MSKDWIAVLGGAKSFGDKQIVAAYQIGREIARCGKHIVTGATTGVPYAASIGAKEEGAMVVGISPAASFEEHVNRWNKPLDYCDCIVYTGMGNDGRSGLLIRSALGAIFVGGEFGTLHEFCAAWMLGGNVLGILEGVGGVTDDVRGMLAKTETDWGSKVIYSTNPVELVHRVCDQVDRIYMERAVQTEPADVCSDVRAAIERFRAQEGKR